jgi:hypothetical protein
MPGSEIKRRYDVLLQFCGEKYEKEE